MKFDKEVSGLTAEVVGLGLLLGAAIWQATTTDWFDRQYFEGEHYIQEDVNFAIIRNQSDIASSLAATNEKTRSEIADEVKRREGESIGKAIDSRNRRHKLQEGQGSSFKSVRIAFFLLGSILVILGKLAVLLFKRESRKQTVPTALASHCISSSSHPPTTEPVKPMPPVSATADDDLAESAAESGSSPGDRAANAA